MQHTQAPLLPFEGHQALWRSVKYLFLGGVVMVAILEYSPGLLAALFFAFGLLLALSERKERLERQPVPQTYTVRLFGDGGSFPNDEAESVRPVSKSARVIDGGSLEHHRR